MLWLYIEAPFAVFRSFTAGWYRPTATFVTPSAAYGLLLNLAGIESRAMENDADHDGRTPASLTRTDLPKARLALGAAPFRWWHGQTQPMPREHWFPRVQTIYQQLHNYPVGASGKERAADAKGNKYNITPVRRELLSDLRAIICMDGNTDFENRVRKGLRGDLNATRYGIPFLGDNQLLVDKITELSEPTVALWYARMAATTRISARSTRLTIHINRSDMTRTTSALFAPIEVPSATIPNTAWVTMDFTA